MHRFLFSAVAALLFLDSATAAEWQWSVLMGNGRAFLWIPPDCEHVRAVVVGQHNMIEQGILEHPTLRKELAKLGMAEVWIAPPFDHVFRFDQDAGEKFDAMMRRLAQDSGYSELAFAPVVPLGHSACASFPWNFAAWNPGRTLAVLSVHGDMPLTPLSGSGKPHPDWGSRTVEGIPGLMTMAEYEWTDARLTPGLDYRAKHPQAAIAMLAEPGLGHFNASDQLVEFLALFIRKAAEQRLPSEASIDHAPVLKSVDPQKGWLVQRPRLNEPRTVQPAPVTDYKGDPKEAFWAFDEETARAIQDYMADQPGKKPQLISITDLESPAEKGCGEPVEPRFLPGADGITFRLKTAFMDAVPSAGNAARWAYSPVGSKLTHATGGGPIKISKIVGPVAQLGPDTFQLQLDRNFGTTDGRKLDIWLVASHPGDAAHKSIVQQAVVHVPQNTAGETQTITFPEIPDQKAGTKSLALRATSSAGLPVHYYVREGPAWVEGDTLHFSKIPPRAKFPVEVTVVAWQWGRSADPKVQTAQLVERTFHLVK
jgi:hypothetical protein